MKNVAVTILFMVLCPALFGQEKPLWLDADIRKAQFPNSAFLTGYAEGNINAGENVEKAIERIQTTAQTALLENIRVVIKSNTYSEMGSQSGNKNYEEYELFSNSSEKSAAAEISGMKTEHYFDKKANYIFAFACVNRYELTGYQKANLSLLLQQAESAMQTAGQLESAGEKAKARKQCEAAIPALAKIRSIQDLLIALDNTANNETLKVAETETMLGVLTQMQARLMQAVYVYVSGNEDLFGKSENIIANKVKADLAHKGCSFVETDEEADFTLKINADVQLSSKTDNIVFCYANVEVELFDTHKQKAVFGDEFSEKGGSSSQEKAGRKAMESASKRIAEKLENWIK
jgi:hypothetical protein